MHQPNLGETEQDAYLRNKRSTFNLLTRLVAEHSTDPAPFYVEDEAHVVEVESPLPPIPNEMMAWASDIVFALSKGHGQIESIQRAVAKKFPGVSLSDIRSARRTADVVKPRQIAMYLAKKRTGRSLPEIGRRFGGRDHTTVLHAVRKIEALRQKDPRLDAEIMLIEETIMDAP